ncbi:asparaginase [Sphingomonas sp. HITSZ_GF]|uniref:asparaginase n=1 Tax=Sphingomonas sp. HITSZ_GF TaxID=3037247 RepID=UPI00240D6A32|nr:asparaginase [Sphingomonas sp. HITSZ_GF]MDG2534421.1 asparaginase [Sphingomonas sp. HITSZ_GF]
MRRLAPLVLLAAAPAAAQEIPPSTPIAVGNEVVPPKKVNPSLPNIRVVSLGGTIVSTAKGRFRYQSYDKPRISIESLVDRLQPEIGDVANVSILKASDIGSQDITTEYLHDLTVAIDKTLADPAVQGVVVTTGTSVLEEVAYWLDLTLRSDKPVVVTGAMRQANTVSWDGEGNLFNAIRLAASRKTTCFGTVVMLDDQFYGAREVTKTDAVRMDTFQARRTGTLGYVDEDRIRAIHAPARVLACHKPEWATPFDMGRIATKAIPRVDIVYSYVDAGGEPIKALVDAGVKGIVTAGTGGGGLSADQNAARKAAIARGVLFASTTRTGSGSSYGGGPGVLPGGDLLPQKARMLLQLGLATGKDEATIRSWFLTIGRPDFNLSGNPEKQW